MHDRARAADSTFAQKNPDNAEAQSCLVREPTFDRIRPVVRKKSLFLLKKLQKEFVKLLWAVKRGQVTGAADHRKSGAGDQSGDLLAHGWRKQPV
jgi:hypothetical protein